MRDSGSEFYLDAVFIISNLFNIDKFFFNDIQLLQCLWYLWVLREKNSLEYSISEMVSCNLHRFQMYEREHSNTSLPLIYGIQLCLQVVYSTTTMQDNVHQIESTKLQEPTQKALEWYMLVVGVHVGVFERQDIQTEIHVQLNPLISNLDILNSPLFRTTHVMFISLGFTLFFELFYYT